jgi:hypothetical protein
MTICWWIWAFLFESCQAPCRLFEISWKIGGACIGFNISPGLLFYEQSLLVRFGFVLEFLRIASNSFFVFILINSSHFSILFVCVLGSILSLGFILSLRCICLQFFPFERERERELGVLFIQKWLWKHTSSCLCTAIAHNGFLKRVFWNAQKENSKWICTHRNHGHCKINT